MLKVVKPLQNLRAVVELVRYMTGIKQMTIQRVELLVIASGASDDRGDGLTVDAPLRRSCEAAASGSCQSGKTW